MKGATVVYVTAGLPGKKPGPCGVIHLFSESMHQHVKQHETLWSSSSRVDIGHACVPAVLWWKTGKPRLWLEIGIGEKNGFGNTIHVPLSPAFPGVVADRYGPLQ